MDTFVQSGTGAQMTREEITQGDFSSDTFFIETGTGRKVTQDDIFSDKPQQAPKIEAPNTDQIETPTEAPTPQQAPETPEPEAPAQQESFFTGLSEQVEKQKKAFEAEIKRQTEDINNRIEKSQNRLDELTEQQEAMLETDIEPLTQPFRQELQEAERERLHINENFQANQELVRELDTLLTEGNEMIRAQRERFASRASVQMGVSRAMEDVTARAGVIQSVISARSGQIGEAQRMIDRTINTINADRQDQLNFYETVFNFTEKQRDEEGNKLIKLEKSKRDFLNTKLSTLKEEMDTAKENAEQIKQAMIDPDTALLYAQAGVKITDSQEKIAEKISEASYAREVRNTRNEMVQDGFTPLAPGENAPVGTQVSEITDSKGNTKRFYKEVEDTSTDDTPTSGVEIPTFDEFVNEIVENGEAGQFLPSVLQGQGLDLDNQSVRDALKNNPDLKQRYDSAVSEVSSGLDVGTVAEQTGFTTTQLNKGLAENNMTLAEFIQLSRQKQRNVVFGEGESSSSPDTEESTGGGFTLD